VWRMCCLWVHTRARLRALFLPGDVNAMSQSSGVLESMEFQRKQTEFREGRLDLYLLERCRAMEAALDLEDLHHIRERRHKLMNAWTPDALAGQLDVARLSLLGAEYPVVKAEVAKEASSWADYLLSYQLQQEAYHSAVTRAREDAEDQRARLIAAHQSTSFPACVLKEHDFQTAMQAGALAACEAGVPGVPRTSPEAVLRLNIINCAALGVWHHRRLPSLVQAVSLELQAHPKSAAVLVMLPSTPGWGYAVQPGKKLQAEFDRLVEEAKQKSLAALHAIPGTRSKTVTGQWDIASMCPTLCLGPPEEPSRAKPLPGTAQVGSLAWTP